MSTEIKNTLFRFVSMRAPELSEEKQKDKRFIFRPGHDGFRPFDEAVASRGSKTKWQAMAEQGFDAYSKIDQVRENNEKLYDLGVWIARNKHSFTTDNLLKEIEIVGEGLNENQCNEMWNNLFYQVVHQKDFYLKEALMQLLIANHVFNNRGVIVNELEAINKKLLKNPAFDQALIKNIVHAKVVLPKELFTEAAEAGAGLFAKVSNKEGENGQPAESLPGAEMLRVQQSSLAQMKIERLQNLQKELQNAEKAYRKEYEKAFNEAEEGYQREIKPIMDRYNKEVREIKENWCSVRDPKIPYDANDPCNEPPALPMPELPKFKFEFREEMTLEEMQQRLSDEAMTTLLDLKGIAAAYEEDNTASRLIPSVDGGSYGDGYAYSQTYNEIQEAITGNTQVVVNNTPSQSPAAVSYNGAIIPLAGTASPQPAFSYQICPTVLAPRTVVFYLTVELPDSTWIPVESGSYCTITKNGTNNNTGGLFIVSRTGNTLTLKVQNTVFTSDSATVSQISGAIAFSNGVKKTFTVDSTPESSVVKSCFSAILSGGTVVTVPDPKGGEGSFIPTGFGVKQLGIADYKKVESTTQGYVEGDVAHIENVMAREHREKATRKLSRSEITEIESTDSEREQITDTSSTNRFELQSEVARVLQETKDKSISAHVDGSYGPISFGVAGSLATHSSKEESAKQAMTQAKEITAKASDRIVSKVHKERTAKMIEEFEENNLHEFDNRKGDKHVVGVYRWVDKVFKNQIYNFGKRLMFEFMIPEPSKLHVYGMSENLTQGSATTLVKPVDPRTFVDAPGATVLFNMKDYSKVNETTVRYWAGMYNVEVPEKLNDYIICGESFGFAHDGTSLARHEGNSGAGKIEIPDGYVTTEGYINFTAAKDNDSQVYSGMLVSLGKVNKFFSSHNGGIEKDFTFSLAGYVGKVPVSYTMSNFFHGNVNASVKCELTAESKSKWQKETFKAILDAYDKALDDYNKKLAEENAKGVKIKGENPGFYRQIENMVLRKNCISYIIDQNPNAPRTYGKTMDNGQATFGQYEVKLDAALDDYASFSKFIEQAFEWDIMSYNFYPYYWGKRQDWPKLYQYDNNDPLFRNFMQAGMARVIVTVRPGFEEAVRYYMQTGQIWNGGEVPVIDDELFLSIVDELRQPEGKKEGKAWATRLPTSLTILQAQTIGLNVTKALPFEDELDDFENPDDVPQSDALDITNSEIGGALNPTIARLIGRIEGNEGIEAKIVLKNTDGTLRNLDYCDTGGNWEISGIPAGRYELLLDAEDDFADGEFEVLEGSKALTVELTDDQTLEVNLKVHKL